MSVFGQTFFLVFPEISSFFGCTVKTLGAFKIFTRNFTAQKVLLGGSSQFGKWSRAMLKKSPEDRVLPLPNGLFMACQWVDPNHFLTGMILQVGGGLKHF